MIKYYTETMMKKSWKKRFGFSMKNLIIFSFLIFLSSNVFSQFKIDATYSASPLSITLNWNSQGAGSQVAVSRRMLGQEGSATWVAKGTFTDPTLSYVDNTIVAGTTYEYKLVKVGDATKGAYIVGGVEIPMVEARGTILLVVDNTLSTPLAPELAIFKRDLVGDGWNVVQYNSPRHGSGTPETLKTWIKAQYTANPTTVKGVILFGHLPIVKSGYDWPDGHELRPHAADLFYADMDGTWTDNTRNIVGKNIPGDGIYDQNYLPAPNNKVEIQIARIDFAGMTAFSSSEIDLFRNYISKNHKFRNAITVPEMKGVGGNGYCDIETSHLYSLFGSANTVQGTFANTESTAYTWGVDFGDYNGANYSSYNYKMAFAINFGSYKQNFENDNNPMRAILCMPEYGLTCAWGSRPNWFFHHMGMGQTIGYGAYRTYNNYLSEYTPGGHYSDNGAVFINLVGDPTLRMHNVKPVSNLAATLNGGSVGLSWTASPDANVGYHVYLATSEAGPYTRVTTTPLTGTTYTDASPGSTSHYMVRVLKLESVISGSYYNLSQGVYVNHPSTPFTDTEAPSMPGSLTASALTENSFTVNWQASFDNVGVASYELFKDGVSIGTTTSTTFNVSGLANFTRYAITIKAKDAANNVSPSSATLYVRTSVVITAKGQNFPNEIADNLINSNLTDKWFHGDGTSWIVYNYVTSRMWDTYEITSAIDIPERDPKDWTIQGSNDGANWTVLDTQTAQSWTSRGQTKTYTFPNTSIYKYYKWDMVSQSWGIHAAELKFSATVDTQNPTAPTGLSAASVASVGFVLNWTASTDNIGIASYEVFKNGVSIGTTTSTSMTVSGLTASTTYAMTVKAKDPSNNVSSSSTALNVTTLEPDTQAPTVPTGLSASNVTSVNFTLNWTASADNRGVAGYDVYKDGVLYSSTTNTSIEITGLALGTTYAMTVKAKDADANVSVASTSLEVTTLTCIIPDGFVYLETWTGIAGTSVSAIPVSAAPNSTTSITSLEIPSNVAEDYGVRIRGYIIPPSSGDYNFYIASDDNSELWLSTNDQVANISKIANVSAWTNSREWTRDPSQKSANITLSSCTKYYFEVLMKEGSGGDNLAVGWTGPSISTVTVIGATAISSYGSIADTQAPTAPTSLASSTITASSFTLSWTASTDNVGVTGYVIYLDDDSVGSTTNTSFDVSGLSASKSYAVTVLATDAAGNKSAQSTALNVSTITTDIFENINSSTIEIFPNPASDFISIYAEDAIEKISITTISGKLIYENNTSSQTIKIDISNLGKGMYLIKVKTMNEYKIEKLIIE